MEANQDDKLTNGQQAGHILAHTLLGAAVSYATGNDAVTGGASAGVGEATAPLLSQFLYGKDTNMLTAEQKDTVSSIVSALGAGIGLTTGNASDAANAAETSKVAAENNDGGPQTYGQSKAELMKETWEMNNGPIGKLLNKNQKYILIGTDFLPIFGDIKGLEEAKSALDYVFASAAIIPVIGDGAKLAYKQAKASGRLEDVMKAKNLVAKDIKDSGKVTEVSGSQLIRKVENGENLTPVKRGTNGDWNKTLNKPGPNAIVKTDNGFIYKTDKNSRVTSVEANLSLDKNARNGYQQRVSGRKDRLDDDHGGHLIASMFGGPGEGINIVAMNAKFNGSSGEWYKMEQGWQKALDGNKSVKVEIEPIYYGNSKRPSEFIIRQTIDGRPITQRLKNTATGK